ncbi:MAG: hypothetical protein GY869_02690 [Planctomycetes bacterium]|nr:hypothetical protein [Planctomycetota bacterium]
MNEDDRQIEARLQSYRPMAPRGELKGRIVGKRPRMGRPVGWAVAASVAAVLCGGLIWWVISGENVADQDKMVLFQVEREIVRAGQAAQLLAVGDLLGEQPGGEDYAKSHYEEILRNFSDTKYSLQAEVQLNQMGERRIQ